ncbi:glycoside hydrolase family 15 protein [Streptomyces sp. NPDC058758]|uniref:glycoside hydrolase family 15 protein n=1 Tax=Streptomyces sp. NPDC058758 TaxID=3346627 RepID=UPI0036C24CD2
MAGKIEDYALIGDLETAALVGRDGAIDWLCVPRFDSPASFAALLGTARNGQWWMGPAGRPLSRRRAYRGETLVLDTVWETVGGTVRLTDFMPPRRQFPCVVRIVEGLSGHVRMCGELGPRFDHGRVVPRNWAAGERVMRSVAGPDAMSLLCEEPVDLSVTEAGASLRFSVSAGQRLGFVLRWTPSHLADTDAPVPDARAALAETLRFWHDWSAKCRYRGPAREAVIRSLITLKALTYAPTGGIVAAATCSLPESPGGERNWDYRFCWLRDSAFTLSCLMRSGYHEEATAWNAWLIRTIAGEPSDLQPVYGVCGERRIDERAAPWLTGYEDSSPVRIGNAAADQVQLDVYGEVMNTLYSALRSGVTLDVRMRSLIVSFMDHVEKSWRYPDRGLWEVRGPPRHFVHSKVMSWVAADRALRLARVMGLRSREQRWRLMRDLVRREVCDRGWDARQRSFVQYYGSRRIDASALLLPKLGFLPPGDRRVRGTVDAMRRLDHDGFLRRYEEDDAARTGGLHEVDGLPGGEGAFLACSLWYADALSLVGRGDEARAVFDRVLSVRNDVGLLSEEWDPAKGRHLGNTPQAFSHVAVVNTAFVLDDIRTAARRQRSARTACSSRMPVSP